MFLTTKTSSQNISITLLQISLKLHEHRGRYWREKLPWTILEEQFPVPRYSAASEIGNSAISLLWQLWSRCNPRHDNFSSLSNTTVVVIFPKLCLWRRSLSSNVGGIGPEKLYRATLSQLCYSPFFLFARLSVLSSFKSEACYVGFCFKWERSGGKESQFYSLPFGQAVASMH